MLTRWSARASATTRIVIFMSDHGEMLGDHGIYLKGPYFYEPAVHVPLMIAGPRTSFGKASASVRSPSSPTSRPTLLDAAGLDAIPACRAAPSGR